MPVPGRKAKPEGQAVNRNKATHEWIDVADVPYTGKRPALPKKRAVMTPLGPKDVPLQAITKTWWQSASTMPHCILWTASDWSFALATALVADAAFSGGVGAATELRNREKVMGTTVDYRRDLRIRYVEPPKPASEPAPAENVTSMDDYRDL